MSKHIITPRCSECDSVISKRSHGLCAGCMNNPPDHLRCTANIKGASRRCKKLAKANGYCKIHAH